MKFEKYMLRDMRLVMLRILAETPGFRANSSVMTTLLYQLGHTVSRDKVKTELRWLEEQGLLTIVPAESVLVATLSERGQDVAEGRAVVEGIASPRA